MSTGRPPPSPGPAAPRVLVVSPEQWPRALLRAELQEAGYDAVGARTLGEALGHPSEEPGRGPVRLLIVDQRAADRARAGELERLTARHPESRTLLLARGSGPAPPGRWDGVVRRPVRIGAVVEAARRLAPLP